MSKYEVIKAKQWRHVNGATASIYGAVPWQSPAEKLNWTMEECGWTVLNPITGIVGVCRPPWATQEAAQKYADENRPLTMSYGD